MQQQAIILIGKSGSGKGTQTNFMMKTIKEMGGDVFHLETGRAFRDFLRESSYTSHLSKHIARDGGLQPDFLANYFFAEQLIKYCNSELSIIFDGIPRTKHQARILDGTLRFYNIKQPLVIYLEVSNESVIDRMKERGRTDDDLGVMYARLEWFEQETMRALAFFNKQLDYYRVVSVNGEAPPEEIAAKIKQYIV